MPKACASMFSTGFNNKLRFRFCHVQKVVLFKIMPLSVLDAMPSAYTSLSSARQRLPSTRCPCFYNVRHSANIPHVALPIPRPTEIVSKWACDPTACLQHAPKCVASKSLPVTTGRWRANSTHPSRRHHQEAVTLNDRSTHRL